MQHHPFWRQFRVFYRIAVFGITNDRVPARRSVHSDLMHSACDGSSAKPGHPRESADHLKLCYRVLSGFIHSANTLAAVQPHFRKPKIDSSYLCGPMTVDDELVLFDEPFLFPKAALKTPKKGPFLS